MYIKKEQELYAILKRLNDWHVDSKDSTESGYSILEENQDSMNKINALDSQMTLEELFDFSEANRKYLATIIEKQKELISLIKSESNHLTQQLAQINQKSNVVNHYMNKEKSLFIDKDM